MATHTKKMRPDVLCRLLMSCTQPAVCTRVASTSDPVVVLGGTRNVRDVLDDLNMVKCEYVYGGVHCGMMTRTMRLWESGVGSFVHEYDGNVHLTGWSLGGGCAIHMAALMHANGLRRPLSVTTFGAPRCGDTVFARWYASEGLRERTTRYELSKDPVVSLPRGGGYRHAGRRVLLMSDEESNPLWGQHELHMYHTALLKTWSTSHPSVDG